MMIIKNRWLPPKGFNAINLFGVIFTRKEKLSKQTLRHEAVHTAQMRELAYILFYVWYLLEFVVRLFQYQNRRDAYRNVSFEREAFMYDTEAGYVIERKRYAFLNFKKKRDGKFNNFSQATMAAD